MKWLNSLGGEWRNEVTLGRDVFISSEIYQPLSARQYFFVAPRVSFSIDRIDLYADDLRLAEYRDQTTAAAIDFGVNFAQYGEARIGALVGKRELELRTGGVFLFPGTNVPVVLPTAGRFDVGVFTFSAKLDRLDSIDFPKHGYYARGNIVASSDLLGADERYTRWDALVSAPVTWGRHTIEATLAAGGRIGADEVPVYEQFGLGGS